jgi:hypothetical protein
MADQKTESKDQDPGIVLPALISTFILFSPNFLFLLEYFQEHYYLLLIINFGVIFFCTRAIAQLRYSAPKQ